LISLIPITLGKEEMFWTLIDLLSTLVLIYLFNYSPHSQPKQVSSAVKLWIFFEGYLIPISAGKPVLSCFCDFPQFFLANAGILSRTGHDLILENQFNLHRGEPVPVQAMKAKRGVELYLY
jgi:hypothetical protein